MSMRAAAALAALALLLAGCGDGGSDGVPRGNPDSRHGPAAVDDYAAVELLRARIVASSDAYYAGGSAGDARTQLRRARAAYDVMAPRVKENDPVVDREVVARFDELARALRRGTAPDRYRDLAGPLGDQLMDGVTQALVPQSARTDRGVQAEALRRVTTRLAATYDASAGGSDETTTRLAFEESWGLWRRALALTTLIKSDLGGQKNTVAGSLNGLRGSAFPDGPNLVDAPPADRVDKAGTKVIDALDKRFGFDAL
jgi:hypothetical protein